MNYFKKGELVDVIGKTIGKGFAGVIKRHNFSMQDATHGNFPFTQSSRVNWTKPNPWKSIQKVKKCQGTWVMLEEQIQNLEIIEIDEERNLLFIKGSVSGHVNSDVIVTPAIKSKKINREIFVTLDQSSEAQPETPETTSEAQPETPETSSEAQPETPETSSEAQPENSRNILRCHRR